MVGHRRGTWLAQLQAGFMEQLLRKYTWALNLAFVALAALLLARTANLFIESAVAPQPSDRLGNNAGPPKREEAPPRLDLEKLAKNLGMPAPVVEPDVTEPGRAVVDPNAAPVKSDLRVKLLGTLMAVTPEWTFAAIQDLGNQKTQNYRIGDKVLGAEVLDIERAKVIVLNNGRKEYIANDPNEPPPVAAGPAVHPPDMAALGAGVRATGENTYEIPRSEIDRTLGDLNQVAMQARIVPAFKDGQAQGFKLFSIRPDSIYSKIGIVNGDVIKRINGFDLNSPEKALEIYSKLKEANRIDIEIERNGAPIRKQYTVR
jgi:general secretion pathway protein C